MASGVAVVGTATGGAAEILVQDENALIFPAEDVASLVQQLKQLIESPSLRKKLGSAARETARGRFAIRRMTEEIDVYLQTLVN